MATVQKKRRGAAITSREVAEPMAVGTIEVVDPVAVPEGFVAVWADGSTSVCVGGLICETVGDGIFHVPAEAVATLVETHGFQVIEG